MGLADSTVGLDAENDCGCRKVIENQNALWELFLILDDETQAIRGAFLSTADNFWPLDWQHLLLLRTAYNEAVWVVFFQSR